MAGHSKWANIKHKKARNDAKRGKAWSKCAKAIMVAAKNGGGSPETNLTLRYAIDDAKAENMPKDTIENAIKKGTGELNNGETWETIVYEGYGPNGVAVLVEALTNNRNRTAGEIRKIFERGGGNLGATGCVAYIFHQKGQALVEREGVDEDTVTMAALEGGAEDVVDLEDTWQVLCDPSELTAVRESLEAAGLTVKQAGLTMIPDNTVECAGNDARKALNLFEILEDHDDVQKVHANFDISEEDLAALEA